MEDLTFSIDIHAPKVHVWNTMLTKDTYDEWIKPFSENSTFIGEWKEGAEIIFYDPAMGGTKAMLQEIVPLEKIRLVHTAMVNKQTEVDHDEYSDKWIGSTETYVFEELDGVTTVTIRMSTHSDFVDMANSWQDALHELKKICEQS